MLKEADARSARGPVGEKAGDRKPPAAGPAPGITESRFLLHYQPRYALRSGQIVGAEAMMRSEPCAHAPMPPSSFSAHGVEDGLLGRPLRLASANAAGWPAGLVLSMTAGPEPFAQRAVLTQIAAALDESGLPPERLEIAFSESLVAGADEGLVFLLAALLDRGIGVVLDRFGHGTASLNILRRLPLTAMKLDPSLLRGVPHRKDCALFLRAIVDAARAVGLAVVAGGVETESQQLFLADIGCDRGQGPYFSLPLPIERLRDVAGIHGRSR